MFRGAITALITPQNCALCGAAIAGGLANHGGIDGLVPVGTTGESPTLSHAEHERVVEVVVEAAAGLSPVPVPINSRGDAFTRHAEKAGADGGCSSLITTSRRAVRAFCGDCRKHRAADYFQYPQAPIVDMTPPAVRLAD